MIGQNDIFQYKINFICKVTKRSRDIFCALAADTQTILSASAIIFSFFFHFFVCSICCHKFFLCVRNNMQKEESDEYFMSINNLPYAGFIRQAIIIITARPNLFMYILNCHNFGTIEFTFCYFTFFAFFLCVCSTLVAR